MSVKRIVDTSFWNDEKVVEKFTPEDKYFMLYLLTNPHSTQLGVYQITKRHMAFELGYSVEAVSALIDRFENRYGIIKYSTETSEVAIKNYLKYSIVKGGKPVEDLLIKELALIKDKSLLRYVYDNIHDCETLIDTIKRFLPRLIGEKEKVSQKEKDFNENVNGGENDNDNDNDNEVTPPVTGYDTLYVTSNDNPQEYFFSHWNVRTDDLTGREAGALGGMDFEKLNAAMEKSKTYLQTEKIARYSTFYIRNYKRIIAGYYDDDKHEPSKGKNTSEPTKHLYDMEAIKAEDRSGGLF